GPDCRARAGPPECSTSRTRPKGLAAPARIHGRLPRAAPPRSGRTGPHGKETPMQLQDKVAIVTGAASGIGKEIAREYVAAGAKVAIADLSLAAAQAAADELGRGNGAAMAVEMNVIDEAQVDAGVARVVEAWGGVDVLVSNAGIQIISPIVDFKYEDWKKVVAIHLDGSFL